ncbi:hypothetical protein G9A89_001834 [Geosiphon pyriformis]|nr:hypothetical protein G9A89_001834 [Geosiphon pyriformis]
MLNVNKPKIVVASEDLIGNLKDLGVNSILFVEFRDSLVMSLPNKTAAAGGLPRIAAEDPCCYIFTSGTSGLPKAVIVRHKMSFMASSRCRYKFDTRWYCPLPLYHMSALFFGAVSVWIVEGTFIISPKFSAKNLWQEVRSSNANCLQHIGEICRYLLIRPPSINDKDLNIRLAFGNGLKKEIWEEFRERFGIPTLIEFFGQTEGRYLFENINYGPFGSGSVGFRGPMLRFLEKGYSIVKVDYENECPYRNEKTGFCVKAAVNEPGELIVKVIPLNKNSGAYLGIAEKDDKRYLRNVFEKGDLWARFGDLLQRDEDGWIYFSERIGQTFRWKGQNVSTQEVTKHIYTCPLIAEAYVYGIAISGYDGQAGMAVIKLEENTPEIVLRVTHELPQILSKAGLPNYAIPIFVRFIESLKMWLADPPYIAKHSATVLQFRLPDVGGIDSVANQAFFELPF